MELDHLSFPLDIEQQRQLVDQLAEARAAEKKLERRLRRLEHDRDAINAMYESAVNLRDFASREKERQYLFNQTMLDTLASMVMMFDKNMHYVIGTTELIRETFLIEGVFDLTSLSLKEIMGRAVHTAWIEKVDTACKQVLTTAKEIRYTDNLDFLDEHICHVEVTISPALDKAGGILGIVLLLHNITEIVELKIKAENASEAKGSFLANMSHEIRTPMNAILGMTTLLSTTQLDDTQRGYVSNVVRASDSLLNIINDILDFTKIDAQKIELLSEEYDIVELISDVANLNGLRAREKGLDFILDISPTLPKRLIGDELRVKQILTNILSNAVKYTEQGEVILSVTADEAKDRQIILECAVEDTGVGIRPSAVEHLFEPFSQFDRSRNRGIEGTGLGLAISGSLANAMGGSIDTVSDYGAGSVFTLRIPQQVADNSPIVQVSSPGRKNVLIFGDSRGSDGLEDMLSKLFLKHEHLKDSHGLAACLREDTYTHLIYWNQFGAAAVNENISMLYGVHLICVKDYAATGAHEVTEEMDVLFEPLLITDVVQLLTSHSTSRKEEEMNVNAPLGSVKTKHVQALVVDDNEINRIVAEEILKQYDMTVTLAEGGAEALHLAAELKYDIVFMDHMMPGMDGLETAKALRDMGGWYETVPIVALTANALVGSREFFLENRMDDYISKPIEIVPLNEIVLKWIPKEKLILAEVSLPAAEGEQEPLPKELMEVEERCGLNVRAALKRVGGSTDTYLSVLNTYTATVRGKADLLPQLVSEGNWDAFRIEVHAQKSALLNIGADRLSEQARKLELAAAEAKHSYVIRSFGEFVNGALELYGKLSEIFKDEEREGVARTLASAEEQGQLAEVAERMIQLINELESDRTTEEMNQLMSRSYGEETDQCIEEAATAIDSFDYDRAIELLQGLTERN